ncbi:MAG: TonB-dependent receptor plug domain-containing protein [Cyanobacteria bacterium P01_F01_bin.86]
MALIKIHHYLWMVGLASLVIAFPAIAKVTEDQPETYSKQTISDLSEIEPPLANIPVSTPQLAQANVVQIVDIDLQVTSTGIDVFLRTADGQLSMPVTSVVENNFIADIPNAVLSLATANEFQSIEPAVGIDQVTVVNLPGNRVRITVLGADFPPTADLVTTAQELLLSVTPGEDIAHDNPDKEIVAPEEDMTLTSEESDNGLRLIVTAQRTEEDVQDVPISITAFTAQQIEDADIDTFRGVADNTPNYTVFDGTGVRFFDFYSVRGLSNFNFASRDAVGFFIDDVPFDYGAFLTQNLTDIERIEVLRGPQNTIYGRSSQAGAINVITRRPSDTFEFNGFVGYGSFDNVESQASVSGPIVDDRLFFRLSGNYE